MIAHNSSELGDARPGAWTVPAHQREKGRERCAKRERGGVGEPRDPRCHSLDERNRSTGLAECPRSKRQIDHRADAWIGREPNRQIVVAAGLGTRRAHVPARARLRQIRRRNDGLCPGPDGRCRPRASRVSPRRRARRPPHAFSSMGVRLARSCRPRARSRPPGARARPCRPLRTPRALANASVVSRAP